MSTESLVTKRDALALARKTLEERKATLDSARAAWEKANRHLIEGVAQLEEDAQNADRELRDAALEVYAANLDNKKPIEGVEIKLWDVMDFDKQQAETWARTNMPALLALDAGAYKKLLKEVAASKTLSSLITMPGTIRQEPKVSVAIDLTFYLPDTIAAVEV